MHKKNLSFIILIVKYIRKRKSKTLLFFADVKLITEISE